MDRSSKSISLALVGSAVFLSGCKSKNDEASRLAAEKWKRECEQAKKEGKDCPPEPVRTAGRSRVGFIPFFWGSGASSSPSVGARPAGGPGTVSTSSSARGGFGSTGAAHASGAAS